MQKKKPGREDLEAFETAYNAACGSISRGEFGQGEVLLKRARGRYYYSKNRPRLMVCVQISATLSTILRIKKKRQSFFQSASSSCTWSASLGKPKRPRSWFQPLHSRSKKPCIKSSHRWLTPSQNSRPLHKKDSPEQQAGHILLSLKPLLIPSTIPQHRQVAENRQPVPPASRANATKRPCSRPARLEIKWSHKNH